MKKSTLYLSTVSLVLLGIASYFAYDFYKNRKIA